MQEFAVCSTVSRTEAYHIVTLLIYLPCNTALARWLNKAQPAFRGRPTFVAVFDSVIVFAGESCSEDFDGCEDTPCTAGTNCTDLSPTQEETLGTPFNCSQCPQGYEDNDGICVGR